MALSEKHRSSIYQGLTQFLGEEEAQALLSQFPARELDEPVTKEFVRAEIADVRSEMHAGFGSVRVEIADLRSEMHAGFGSIRAEFAGFRGEVQAEFGNVRAEFGSVRAEMAALESQISERFREMTMWVAGALIAGLGASAGIAAGIASLVG